MAALAGTLSDVRQSTAGDKPGWVAAKLTLTDDYAAGGSALGGIILDTTRRRPLAIILQNNDPGVTTSSLSAQIRRS